MSTAVGRAGHAARTPASFGGRVRVLILNWRDIRHPRAGGAEFFTFEVARRLVEQGDEVEWFAAAFPGGPARETIDGVHVVRAGRQWTVHAHAIARYLGRLAGRFDVVVDEVNTIPFLTPLWARIPAAIMIHQLAREVWWYESPFPISMLGWLAEPLYLRIYRRTPALTLAESGRRDLRRLGFRRVTVMPAGIEAVPGDLRAPKAPVPTFAYVGRLAPSKRVGDIVQAFAAFRGDCGVARLWLIGEGPDRARLETLVRRLGLTDSVEFCGRVPADEKYHRLARAHALLMASAREGWGLVVTEANACGTPAVVYDVAGLRDSVRHGETGLVVPPAPLELARGMKELLQDPERYGRLAAEAREWSHGFTFDAATSVIRAELIRTIER